MRPINQTPQSADGAYERETIINFCDAEKTCSYYTRNYSRVNELRKLAAEHPDEVKLTIDKEDCVEAEFPKKWVKFALPCLSRKNAAQSWSKVARNSQHCRKKKRHAKPCRKRNKADWLYNINFFRRNHYVLRFRGDGPQRTSQHLCWILAHHPGILRSQHCGRLENFREGRSTRMGVYRPVL